MRKAKLILLAASLTTLSVQDVLAQSDVVTIGNRVYEAKRFRFGAYIAPTVSWMKPTTNKSDDGNFASESNGSKVGFTYGLMGEYWFSQNYALVSGIQMNMAKGNILSTYVGDPAANNVVTNANMNYKLNYIEVPLNLKMSTDPISNFRFFGQAGFTAGFNIAKTADYRIDYRDDMGVGRTTGDVKNEKIKGALAVSPVLFSMNIGVGAEYPINNKLAAYAGIFFNNGFLPDVTNPGNYNISGVPNFRDGNTRMNNFAFRVGLFF